MREIKFRAWDRARKEMRQVEIMDFSEWWIRCQPKTCKEFKQSKTDILMLEDRNSFENDGTDRHILMQYTGLKDSNGTEIYEGDIVEYLYGISNIGVVSFHEGIYYIVNENHITADLLCGEQDIITGEFKRAVKVVGNIYVDPELLEVNNE